jgi:hypothetical protein
MTTIFTAKRGRPSEKKVFITDDMIYEWERIRHDQNISLKSLPVSNVTYKKAFYQRRISERSFQLLKKFFENQKIQ